MALNSVLHFSIRVNRLNIARFGHLNIILFNLPNSLYYSDNVLLSDAVSAKVHRKVVLAIESLQPQQDLQGTSCGPVVITRAAQPCTSDRWAPDRETCTTSKCCPGMPQVRSSAPNECRFSKDLAEVVIPCRWHFPMAGSGKRLGPKSSDMSSSSGCCNVLKLICQVWWTT